MPNSETTEEVGDSCTGFGCQRGVREGEASVPIAGLDLDLRVRGKLLGGFGQAVPAGGSIVDDREVGEDVP